MNKICKEYIKEVKAMFPVKGRQERFYIKKLSNDIENYCDETNATAKEELYNNYGNPIDIVAEYFSAKGISYVIKKIKFSKYIKALIAIMIAIILIILSTYSVFWYQNHQTALRQEVLIVEDIIE